MTETILQMCNITHSLFISSSPWTLFILSFSWTLFFSLSWTLFLPLSWTRFFPLFFFFFFFVSLGTALYIYSLTLIRGSPPHRLNWVDSFRTRLPGCASIKSAVPMSLHPRFNLRSRSRLLPITQFPSPEIYPYITHHILYSKQYNNSHTKPFLPR